MDQFYPQVGIASLELLEKLGCEVHFPMNQTCCGQPMANSGYAHLTEGCDTNFVANFSEFDYIVCPSGSCTLHIKEHLHEEKREEKASMIRKRVYELTEFLTDVLKVENLEANFPHRVGLHQSCHGQRGLKLAQMTELNAPFFSKPGFLLPPKEPGPLFEPGPLENLRSPPRSLRSCPRSLRSLFDCGVESSSPSSSES